MSSHNNQDQNEKSSLSNVFSIHEKRNKEEKLSPSKYSGVIKSEDFKNPTFTSVRIEKYKAPEVTGKLVSRPEILPPHAPHGFTVETLKQNLKSLTDLHARLHFMLKELEDLINE